MTRVKYKFQCLFVHEVFSYQVCGSLLIYVTGPRHYAHCFAEAISKEKILQLLSYISWVESVLSRG